MTKRKKRTAKTPGPATPAERQPTTRERAILERGSRITLAAEQHGAYRELHAQARSLLLAVGAIRTTPQESVREAQKLAAAVVTAIDALADSIGANT